MNIEELEILSSRLKNALTIINRAKKRLNAINTANKARANGSHIRRPRKTDPIRIKKLRDKGFSLREIARMESVSPTAVRRCLTQDVVN